MSDRRKGHDVDAYRAIPPSAVRRASDMPSAPSAETPSEPVPTMEIRLKEMQREISSRLNLQLDMIERRTLRILEGMVNDALNAATRSASAEGPSEDAMDWEGETRRLLKALIPEGSDLIQRVTQRALELRLAAPPSVGDTPKLNQEWVSRVTNAAEDSGELSVLGAGIKPREPDADALDEDEGACAVHSWGCVRCGATFRATDKNADN